MKWDERIGRRLKLHDLHVFIAVAELGSMRKAADRLAISQPSVSKAIADIEHILSVRLLERNARGVEVTPYGRALQRRAMGAFDELRQGVKDIEVLADPALGEIREPLKELLSLHYRYRFDPQGLSQTDREALRREASGCLGKLA